MAVEYTYTIHIIGPKAQTTDLLDRITEHGGEEHWIARSKPGATPLTAHGRLSAEQALAHSLDSIRADLGRPAQFPITAEDAYAWAEGKTGTAHPYQDPALRIEGHETRVSLPRCLEAFFGPQEPRATPLPDSTQPFDKAALALANSPTLSAYATLAPLDGQKSVLTIRAGWTRWDVSPLSVVVDVLPSTALPGCEVVEMSVCDVDFAAGYGHRNAAGHMVPLPHDPRYDRYIMVDDERPYHHHYPHHVALRKAGVCPLFLHWLFGESEAQSRAGYKTGIAQATAAAQERERTLAETNGGSAEWAAEDIPF